MAGGVVGRDVESMTVVGACDVGGGGGVVIMFVVVVVVVVFRLIITFSGRETQPSGPTNSCVPYSGSACAR